MSKTFCYNESRFHEYASRQRHFLFVLMNISYYTFTFFQLVERQLRLCKTHYLSFRIVTGTIGAVVMNNANYFLG